MDSESDDEQTFDTPSSCMVHPRVADQLRRGLLVAVDGKEVSNMGRWRSKIQHASYGQQRPDGYCKIETEGRSWSMLHIVLYAFDGLPPRGHTQADHINMDPSDNRLENGEWVSPKENIVRSRELNTARMDSGKKRLKPVLARVKGRECDEWIRYESCSAAANALLVSASEISAHIKRRNDYPDMLSSVKGYEFKLCDIDQVEGETWKTVLLDDGTPTTARVSSFGRFIDTRGTLKTPMADPSGYVTVGVNGSKYQFHRLVATAFALPKDVSKTQVNHKDGDPGNNHVENLEWVTPTENVQHSYRSNKCRKSKDVKSKFFRARTKDPLGQWVTYNGIGDAASKLGLSYSFIQRRLYGHVKDTTNDKYEFKYIPPPSDLPGETWVPMMLPTSFSSMTCTPFDPNRVANPALLITGKRKRVN